MTDKNIKTSKEFIQYLKNNKYNNNINSKEIIKFTKEYIKDLKNNKSKENLVGFEMFLMGRLKGAEKSRRLSTGLGGSLKSQTILESGVYSLSQKQVYTKWGTFGLTVRLNKEYDKKI